MKPPCRYLRAEYESDDIRFSCLRLPKKQKVVGFKKTICHGLICFHAVGFQL